MSLNKSRMFSFITATLNPLGGKCPHNCTYCWSMGSKGLVEKYNMEKYRGDIKLIRKELKTKFKSGSFVFLQDMSDLFADVVPTRYILETLDVIRRNPESKFLTLTKNPERYIRLIKDCEFPPNTVLGVTIETDFYRFYTKDYYGFTHKPWLDYRDFSRAPYPADRLQTYLKIRGLTDLPLFISIEPILDFSLHKLESLLTFTDKLKLIQPWAICVGYDNYGHKLPEPPLDKTTSLIKELEKFTTVYPKTLRKAWYE